MPRLAIFILLLIGLSQPASAQLSEINRLLAGSVDDAELLLTRYMQPLGAGFGAALGTGWTHSARSHSPLGFHVSVQVGAAMVPSSDKSFTVTNDELQALRVVNPEIGSTPTAAGGRGDARYRLELDGGPSSAAFDMPQGARLAVTPVPVIQAGVGLVGATSIVVRGLPSVELGSYGSLSSWGVGVQHGLNQWIPGGSLLPLNLAVQAGYSNLGLATRFEVSELPDQELEWRTHTYSASILAGRTIAVLSVFGGLGIESSSSNLEMHGTYELETPNGTVTVDNPIDTTISGENLLRTFVGARLNLAIVGVRAEYTLANYPSFNLGLSVSLR